jgi:hypothetical protein
MLMRVIDWFPDDGYGFAVSADPFILRKAFVHNNRLTTRDKRLEIGSLIECDVLPPKDGQRHWRAENVKIVK